MNRRHFLKLASFAAMAPALGPVAKLLSDSCQNREIYGSLIVNGDLLVSHIHIRPKSVEWPDDPLPIGWQDYWFDPVKYRLYEWKNGKWIDVSF